MSQRTPTRIELHRLKFHWLGKKTTMLQLFCLEPEEKKLITKYMLERLRTEDDIYDVYAETLADWGIACPHPQHKRRYSGNTYSHSSLMNHRWYVCDCCGCTCRNEDFQVYKENFSY